MAESIEDIDEVSAVVGGGAEIRDDFDEVGAVSGGESVSFEIKTVEDADKRIAVVGGEAAGFKENFYEVYAGGVSKEGV
ncbi:hypothetical protein AGMMS50222_08570 [Endomicrobiia bacterium]|nr:hypothetical protein AGMMS49531_01110 [Endomicrobiia bacterium]GHT65239.1 hypothetical protein AGMMS49556_04710 [Endomicrobiia bacterium]GHT69273.1 hypothetical protein AGMMS49950_01680 [Endomicrobiia bacterium]GHT76263.1 hypothetical protein AGMMS50222_08570 [Endomicrobiia bacterium]